MKTSGETPKKERKEKRRRDLITKIPDVDDAVDRGCPRPLPADADARDGRSVGRKVSLLNKVGGVVDKDRALDGAKPHLIKHLIHCRHDLSSLLKTDHRVLLIVLLDDRTRAGSR